MIHRDHRIGMFPHLERFHQRAAAGNNFVRSSYRFSFVIFSLPRTDKRFHLIKLRRAFYTFLCVASSEDRGTGKNHYSNSNIFHCSFSFNNKSFLMKILPHYTPFRELLQSKNLVFDIINLLTQREITVNKLLWENIDVCFAELIFVY